MMTYRHLGEIAQIVMLSGYLCKAWTHETRLVKTAFPIWIALLAVDVFIFRCYRPAWMQWSVNSIDFIIGWIIIYEKYRESCLRVARVVLAALSSLLR